MKREVAKMPEQGASPNNPDTPAGVETRMDIVLFDPADPGQLRSLRRLLRRHLDAVRVVAVVVEAPPGRLARIKQHYGSVLGTGFEVFVRVYVNGPVALARPGGRGGDA